MAQILTIRVLLDAEEDVAKKEIDALLREHCTKTGSSLIDWEQSDIHPVCDEVDDAIANETYPNGLAFDEFVIYSSSEFQAGTGFWSDTLSGWTSFEFATRVDCARRELPPSRGGDAMILSVSGVEKVFS